MPHEHHMTGKQASASSLPTRLLPQGLRTRDEGRHSLKVAGESVYLMGLGVTRSLVDGSVFTYQQVEVRLMVGTQQ